MAGMGVRDRLAVVAARTAARAARRAGYNATSLPGLVAARLRPGIAGRIAVGLGPVAMVSGTNGKTTTALVLAGILRVAGHPVLANPSGANLRQAVTTALVGWAVGGAMTAEGGRQAASANADHAVFEVDEAALPAVVDEIRPAVLLLTNLFRDQLDRFGETDRIIRLWREMLARHPQLPVVVCADDPRLAALVRGRPGVLAYGFGDRPATGTSGAAVTSDVTACPVCGEPLVTAWVSIGHLGAYRCDACGFQRPKLDVAVGVLADRGLEGQRLAMDLADGRTLQADVPLIGVANAYNAAGALAAALALGIAPAAAATALGQAAPAFARWETLEMAGRRVVLSLVKNPASMDEVTRAGAALRLDGVLFAMNDQHADGRDVSWYWDVDPTPLVPGRRIAIAGARGPDLLLRLRYQLAERPEDGIPGLLGRFERPIDALDCLLEATPAGGAVLVVSTYTALLGLRAALVRRGLVAPMPT